MKPLPTQSATVRRRHEYLCNPKKYLEGRPILCDICYKNFESKETFDVHLEMHERCKCKICNAQCITETGLRIHVRAHFVKVQDNALSNQQSETQCLACDAIFEEAEQLNQHYAGAHQVDTSQPDFMLPMPVRNTSEIKRSSDLNRAAKLGTSKQGIRSRELYKGKFTCDVCGKTFSSAALLKSHTFVHLPDHKGFCCEICGKVFQTPNSIYQHSNRHKRSSYYTQKTCEYCGKQFAAGKTLRLHLYNNHRNEYLKDKPFYCSICCTTFKTAEELDNDLQRHPKCQFCDRRWLNKVKLSEHENSHTSNQPNQCDFCEKRFTRICKST